MTMRDQMRAETEAANARRHALGRKGGRRPIPHVMRDGIELKSCGGCGSLKSLDAYDNDATRWDGKHHKCKVCRK